VHELGHRPDEGLVAWRVCVSRLRLCAQPAHASLKSCNKLLSILARREAEAHGADEALLLNEHGRVAEAAAANVFWLRSGRVLTPPLTEGGLEGVTRELTLNVLLPALGMSAVEAVASPDELKAAEGVFLTLSTLGVVGVSSLDGQSLKGVELARTLHRAYWTHVQEQTRAG